MEGYLATDADRSSAGAADLGLQASGVLSRMLAEFTIETVRIFVSSPGDVAEERALTARVLDRLRGEFDGRACLEPTFWEHEAGF